ncbi:MAG TPA: IclR family transcriptional regulator [Actinomycetota bacterium]|jgi:DNA-binding IclR family transcriptional regulator|nr:IclR family transcriptional regulator [Actinomycetota bacterium]
MGTTRSGVGTLDRAVAVLEAVEGGARTFTEVARRTGLSRTTAHRLVKALEGHRFLAFYEGFGYRLGPRLLRLANEAAHELPLRDVAHPILERLARSTGESAQLFVRSGDARICLDAVESANELRTIVPVGSSLPLYAGSAAKVFLAWDPGAARHVRRASDPERFRREVELVRPRGWASSSGERQPGVGSVSAPVVGAYDLLLAVVSVSGPASRIGRGSAKRYAPAVVRAAREIERELGG